MWKLSFIVIALVIAFIAWQELNIFRGKEILRKKKLSALTAGKDTLEDETIRADTLDITAEASVRKAQNDAFEKEIDNIREK